MTLIHVANASGIPYHGLIPMVACRSRMVGFASLPLNTLPRSGMYGFTLIELLVVIAIIAVLAAVVAPNAFRAIEKAQVQKAVADMKAIRAAAMHHYTDTGRWPPPINSPPFGAGFLTNDDGAGNPVAGWDGPYLERWPSHPWNKAVVGETTYQWDYKDVDPTAPGNEWTVELGLADADQQRRNYLAGLIDRTIDAGDGPCAGSFMAYCPPGPSDWAGWPKYVAARN